MWIVADRLLFPPCVTFALTPPRARPTNSAQRNTYLTGFCLFLSLILTRTFYILLDQLDTQEQLAAFKKAVSASLSPRRVEHLTD